MANATRGEIKKMIIFETIQDWIIYTSLTTLIIIAFLQVIKVLILYFTLEGIKKNDN